MIKFWRFLMINRIWWWIKIRNFIIGEVEDKNSVIWKKNDLQFVLIFFLMECFMVELLDQTTFHLYFPSYLFRFLYTYLYNRFKMNCRLDGGKE